MRRSPTNHKGSELPEALGTRYSDTHAELSAARDTYFMTQAEPPINKPTYVPYAANLESPAPEEQQQIDKITAALRKNNELQLKKNHGHAIRDAHAKSHGILRGELTVHPDLPDHLRQGMFAEPGKTYPVIARLSTTAGAIRSDQVRGVRGLAIKVLGVLGPRVLPDDEAKTQDFVFVNHKVFPTGDAKEYLTMGVPLAWVLARTPDRGMLVVNAVLRGAKRLLKRFGAELPDSIGLFAGENTYTLGETFYSAAPIRFGNYVAKISIAPSSGSVTALTGKTVSADAGPDAHTKAVVDFFRNNSAEYVVSAQLLTDAGTMKIRDAIEDAKLEWSEDDSPYQPVATITYPVQDSFSDERRSFGDDVLEFNSWRAIEDHRPLGSINRLKKEVYLASSEFRHEKNGKARREPQTIDELPK